MKIMFEDMLSPGGSVSGGAGGDRGAALPTATIGNSLGGNRKKLFDFGSGDGRLVIEAAKRGYDARGVEINPYLYYLSKFK